RRAHEPLPPRVRSARDADALDRRVRRRRGASRREGRRALDRLDAVHLSLQPHPAAGRVGALRADEGRPAGGTASRRTEVRRCARAPRLPRVRVRAPLPRPRPEAAAAQMTGSLAWQLGLMGAEAAAAAALLLAVFSLRRVFGLAALYTSVG